MDALVACPCGHDVERHTHAGCPGSPREQCSCKLSFAGALEAAILAVRSTWHRPDAAARPWHVEER